MDLEAQDHKKNTKFEWTWPKSTCTWWTLHHCWLGASTTDSQASSTLRWSCTRRKASTPWLSPQCTFLLVQLIPPCHFHWTWTWTWVESVDGHLVLKSPSSWPSPPRLSPSWTWPWPGGLEWSPPSPHYPYSRTYTIVQYKSSLPLSSFS